MTGRVQMSDSDDGIDLLQRQCVSYKLNDMNLDILKAFTRKRGRVEMGLGFVPPTVSQTLKTERRSLLLNKKMEVDVVGRRLRKIATVKKNNWKLR